MAATEGILQVLSEHELEGVIAHELAHVKHRDILISSVAATMAAAIMMVARMAHFAALFGGYGGRGDDRERGNNPIALLAMMILAPLAAMLIQMAISRSREFAADAGGAQHRRQPLRAGGCAAQDRRGVQARSARRQPGDGAHVHHQAVLGRRADVALQQASADRSAHPRAPRRHAGKDNARSLWVTGGLPVRGVRAAGGRGRPSAVLFSFQAISRRLGRLDWPSFAVHAAAGRPVEPERIAVEAAVEDFDIPQNKMAESAERVVDRALDEARRRDHALLTNEHVCLAFAQVEWDMFGQVMRDLELNPHEILQALEEHLRLLPSVPGRDLRVAPSTKLLFKLALLHASRSGRHTIEATDLFSAIFEETQGIPVSIIRRHGIEPEALVTRLATRMRDHETA